MSKCKWNCPSSFNFQSVIMLGALVLAKNTKNLLWKQETQGNSFNLCTEKVISDSWCSI